MRLDKYVIFSSVGPVGFTNKALQVTLSGLVPPLFIKGVNMKKVVEYYSDDGHKFGSEISTKLWENIVEYLENNFPQDILKIIISTAEEHIPFYKEIGKNITDDDIKKLKSKVSLEQIKKHILDALQEIFRELDRQRK